MCAEPQIAKNNTAGRQTDCNQVACSICGSESPAFGKTVILRKYEVQYYRCRQCGFIQTETPHWLEEAYSSAIAQSDLGYVTRNVRMSKITRAVIATVFKSDRRFLDYGGGYGMFVRLMRDAGFNFYRYDRFCRNLFATGFDIEDPLGEARNQGRPPFALLTAFEVFEHLTDPISEVQAMLQLAPAILFSTFVVPSPAPPPGAWWYYVPDHGQHISLYTVDALHALARRLKLCLCTDGKSIHMLSKARESNFWFSAVSRSPFYHLINLFRRRQSLLPEDSRTVGGLNIS